MYWYENLGTLKINFQYVNDLNLFLILSDN